MLDAQYYVDVRHFPDELLAGVGRRPSGGAFERPSGQGLRGNHVDVNYRAGVELARQAKAAGVRAFVFASSCSVYGAAEERPRNSIPMWLR